MEVIMAEHKANRGMSPTHPGETIEELFEINGLKVMPTANILSISRQQLHRILKCEAPVTPQLAVKIGKLFGNGPRLWLNMQASYDAWRAERDYADEVAKIKTLPQPPLPGFADTRQKPYNAKKKKTEA
jgi:antitoxin HigA-1